VNYTIITQQWFKLPLQRGERDFVICCTLYIHS